jgi:hypothetical protein
MPQYKVLKSVAHNIGHSFTSLMNYSGDDYVMGHILRLARASGRDTLRINFVTGEADPPDLLDGPVSNVPANYTNFFWHLVTTQGSDRSLVSAASLTLHYDIGIMRARRSDPSCSESPYTCEIRVTDNRGRNYAAKFRGWWYPEQMSRASRSSWKFWEKR